MEPSAMSFFHTLALKADLSAHEDPARSQALKDVELNKKCVNSLPVVNDWAARDAKLKQGFNFSVQLVKNRTRIFCVLSQTTEQSTQKPESFCLLVMIFHCISVKTTEDND